MILERQVTSLSLSKRLKELGVPQKSLFYWARTILDEVFSLYISEHIDLMDGAERVYVDSGSEGDYWHVKKAYSAFTASELGELLPGLFRPKENHKHMLYTWSYGNPRKWGINYKNEYNDSWLLEEAVFADSLVEAMGKMLIYVLENKAITLK